MSAAHQLLHLCLPSAQSGPPGPRPLGSLFTQQILWLSKQPSPPPPASNMAALLHALTDASGTRSGPAQARQVCEEQERPAGPRPRVAGVKGPQLCSEFQPRSTFQNPSSPFPSCLSLTANGSSPCREGLRHHLRPAQVPHQSAGELRHLQADPRGGPLGAVPVLQRLL